MHASFNGKDWEIGQSICAVRMSRKSPICQSCPLTFTNDAPPARVTRELPAATILSIKLTGVTYEKRFKVVPYARHLSFVQDIRRIGDNMSFIM